MTAGSDEDEKLFVRGNHKALWETIPKRFLQALNPNEPASSKVVRGKSLNNPRLWLAEQFSSKENPLTRRVIVNRLWHYLMGRGIVASVDNFGVLGQEPTHPELMDFLAEEFDRQNWSIKTMIRRIVLSQTYRMSSEINPNAIESDPDNKLLHRANIKRLQGEIIRDSMLQISGRLDKKMYGRSVPVHLTPFMQGRGRPGKSGPLDGHGRRSIYIEVRRNFVSPFMLAFDTPTPFNTVGRRNQSNVPAQALILMNDPFVADQAKAWAKTVIQKNLAATEMVDQIYLTALGRKPSADEMKRSLRFIEQFAEENQIKADDISKNESLWADFCHVMFNLKEFIYIK